MNPKLILCLALVSIAVSVGCAVVSERPPATPKGASETKTSISEIHMLDAQNGWAFTSGGNGHPLLLRTNDGGKNWRNCTPRGISDGRDINDVPDAGDVEDGIYFFDSQNGWVSTYDRKKAVAGLLRTRNGGKSWSYCKTANLYRDFHFFNANHGIAREAEYGLGSAYFRFFETHDGGKTWKPVIIASPYPEMNLPPGTIHICNLCRDTVNYYPPAKVIITHGDMADEQPKAAVRLSLSTNLGKTWRDLNLPLPSEKYREGLVTCDTPVFFDGKNGWLPMHIIKENDGHTFAFNVMVFYTTNDGGERWTARPGIIEGGSDHVGGERQFDLASAKDIFVRGGPNLYVTHDGAKSWRTIKPNIDFGRLTSNRDVLQIDFVDATHGWVVISDNFNHSPYGNYYLYKTSDGGVTWMELPLKIKL
jgi:photosystem II stability/assembly factor-like uncharacterized protein